VRELKPQNAGKKNAGEKKKGEEKKGEEKKGERGAELDRAELDRAELAAVRETNEGVLCLPCFSISRSLICARFKKLKSLKATLSAFAQVPNLMRTVNTLTNSVNHFKSDKPNSLRLVAS